MSDQLSSLRCNNIDRSTYMHFPSSLFLANSLVYTVYTSQVLTIGLNYGCPVNHQPILLELQACLYAIQAIFNETLLLEMIAACI